MISHTVRSILIVQTKFFGDLILVEPLARALRQRFPEAKIVLLCAEGFDRFAVAHGMADEAMVLRRKKLRGSLKERAGEFIRIVGLLRKQSFDLTVDVTDTKTSRTIISLIRTEQRVRYRRVAGERERWYERNRGDLLVEPLHDPKARYLDRYLSPLATLGVGIEDNAPVITPLAKEVEDAAALLRQHGLTPGGFIAVHAGASFPGRRWQPDRFARAMDEVARATGLRFVLVGGPDETEIGQEVIGHSQVPPVDLVGAMPFGTLAAFLAEARLFLGNESGPMHLAAAVGTPVVGLYGLTDPARWGAVGVPFIPVRPSQPCTCIVPGQCKWPDPSRVCCVWRVEVGEVTDALGRLLAATEIAPPPSD